MSENHQRDHKSLRLVTGRTADWHELAKDCVRFANARGGVILIGIEDDADEPAADQEIPAGLTDRIRKRVKELTVNVEIAVSVNVAENGGQYMELRISRSSALASTTDGRYYLRVADDCKPLVGEAIQRLLNERGMQSWEILTTLGVPQENADPAELERYPLA